MRETDKREIEPNKDEGKIGEEDVFVHDHLLLKSGEIVRVRQIKRQKGELIGFDAGTLLRLICKAERLTTGEVCKRAKKLEEEMHYNPELPELKYIEFGERLDVFHFLSREEMEIVRSAERGIKLIR